MRNELQSAREFLLAHLPPSGASVLVAVSGGLDSMCLLHLLNAWGEECGVTVTAAHFNHQLRAAAAGDETFVRDYCGANSIFFVRGSGDTRALAAEEGLSLEEAARTLRYAFLEQAATEQGCAYILTAHHADDNAETLLLNLIRGTGSAGLSGIPPVRGRLLRPFLTIPRTELEAYAAAHDVSHVFDETNALDDASRNVLRHKVLPVLRDLNPRAVENMARASTILAEEAGAMDVLAADLLARQAPGQIRLMDLNAAPRAVRGRAVLRLMERVCGCGRDLGAAHVSAVLGLASEEQKNREVSLPYGMRAWNDGQNLQVARTVPAPEPQPIVPGGTAAFGPWTVTLAEHPGGWPLSAAVLAGPLYVTVWRAEDRLTLPGSRGERTLKRLCADAGISPMERDRLPVLRAGERPVAVALLGIDTRFAPCSPEETVFVTFTFHQDTEENSHEK